MRAINKSPAVVKSTIGQDRRHAPSPMGVIPAEPLRRLNYATVQIEFAKTPDADDRREMAELVLSQARQMMYDLLMYDNTHVNAKADLATMLLDASSETAQ